MKLLNYRFYKSQSCVFRINSLFRFALRLNRRIHYQKTTSIVYSNTRTVSKEFNIKTPVNEKQAFVYEYNSGELKENIRKTNGTLNESSFPKLPKLEGLSAKSEVISYIYYVIYLAKLGYCPVQVIGDGNLELLLVQIRTFIDQMTANELVASLVAFHLAKVPLHHPIARELTIRVTSTLKDSDEFPLQALANLAIFSRENSSKLFPYIFCVDGMSHIMRYLKRGNSLEDLYYITVYFSKLTKFATREVMSAQKAAMKKFLDCTELSLDDAKMMAAIINFYAKFRTKNTRIVRNISIMLQPHIPNLSNADLRKIATMRDIVMEPASTTPLIVKEAESRADKSTDLDLVYTRSASHLPNDIEQIAKDIDEIVNRTHYSGIRKNEALYRTIKYAKYVKRSTYINYWDKVTTDLSAMNPYADDFYHVLSELCYRYISFNSFLGVDGKRCEQFETVTRMLVLNEIKYGISGYRPDLLARFASFIIGYANNKISTHGWGILPEYLVQKIEEMSPQFNFQSLIDISFGVQNCYRNGFPKHVNRRDASNFISRLGRIENVLNECIQRLVKERLSIKIDAICALIASCNNQRNPNLTPTLDILIKYLENDVLLEDAIITSQSIHVVTGNLSKISYIVPKLCEKMLEYVNENSDAVGGVTVGRLLYYLFSMGYEPNNEMTTQRISNSDDRSSNENASKLLNADLFDFEKFSSIIHRDFNFMNGLLIVQACLALSYYQALPMELINRIFDMNFIVRLEKEMTFNSNSKNYPKNVLNMVMELNRSICLNYPEANVPWFQQNFIEAQLSAVQPRPSAYIDDVYKMLLSFVKNDHSLIRINHVTPYGYRIPFVIYLNSLNQVVSPPMGEGSQTLTKVAILPLMNKSFCSNTEKRLRGLDRLQERHLGMLGYNVIQICYREWNSMHMNLPGAREDFLRTYLFNNAIYIE